MSGRNRDERHFLDTLSDDLASEVFEDEEACEEALKAKGTEVDAAVARLREAAGRAVAVQRRARIAALAEAREARAAPAGKRDYGCLDRAQLLKLIDERQGTVEHRELQEAPEEDLRTLLEDLDALEDAEKDEE